MRLITTKLAVCTAAGIGAAVAIRSWKRYTRRISFRNRVVLITGGSRGLGLVLARQFSQQGARVAICARDSAELARAEAELRQGTSQVYARVCDVTRQEDADRLIDNVQEVLGPIDVLINNAGIICVGPIESMTMEDFELAMQTHFWGPLYTMRRVLPTMRSRQSGRIVNIASIGGKISVPHLVPYCASKFALVGFSQGMRAELAKDGILVTTVSPGLMRTGSPRHAMFKGQHRAEYTWFSISGSLPGLSIQAERAAQQILDACRHGDPELIISAPAKIAVWLAALAPQIAGEAFAIVNRLLPQMDGGTTYAKKGFESQTRFSPSWLTVLNERAARKNNEFRPARRSFF